MGVYQRYLKKIMINNKTVASNPFSWEIPVEFAL